MKIRIEKLELEFTPDTITSAGNVFLQDRQLTHQTSREENSQRIGIASSLFNLVLQKFLEYLDMSKTPTRTPVSKIPPVKTETPPEASTGEQS